MVASCESVMPSIIIYSIIVGAISIGLITWTINFIIKFRTKDKQTASKLLFGFIIIFLILSIICLAFSILTRFHYYCYDSDYWQAISDIRGASGGLSYFLLVPIWYIRLNVAFKDSVLSLSRCTTIFWYVYFGVTSIFCLLWGITVKLVSLQIWSLINLLGVFIIFFGSISLNTMFIYKLFKIGSRMENAHHNNSKDDVFRNLITRIVILTFTSFSIFVISVIVNTMYINVYYDITAFEFLKDYFGIIDVSTNCIFMLLSYRYYDTLYYKLCNYCHIRCIQCIDCCKGDERKLSTHIAVGIYSKSPKSATSPATPQQSPNEIEI